MIGSLCMAALKLCCMAQISSIQTKGATPFPTSHVLLGCPGHIVCFHLQNGVCEGATG